MPNTADLNPDFGVRLAALLAASGGRVHVISGFRSNAQQQALWDLSDKTGRMVARPGHSQHERGLAADLGGDLRWVAANAARFGLTLPMLSYEPWHVEPVGAREKGSPLAYTPNPAQALTRAPPAAVPSDPAPDLNAQLDEILRNPFDFSIEQPAPEPARV